MKGLSPSVFTWINSTFTLRIKEGFSVLDNAEAFLKKVIKESFCELMTLPIRRERESAYSIVSGAAIKRILFRSFCAVSIRYMDLLSGFWLY